MLPILYLYITKAAACLASSIKVEEGLYVAYFIYTWVSTKTSISLITEKVEKVKQRNHQEYSNTESLVANCKM